MCLVAEESETKCNIFVEKVAYLQKDKLFPLVLHVGDATEHIKT